MAQQNIRGSLAAFLQDWTRHFDPWRGWLYRYNYKGLSESQMESLQNAYSQGGCTCSLRVSAGISTLEVEDSTQQYTLDNWQIVGNELEVDILSHPTMLAILDIGLSENDLRKLRSAFESLDQDWDDIYSTMEDTDNGPTLERFYNLFLRGTTGYRRQQYVLRHTTNAPNRWAANISDFGVGNIYTTSQLLSEAQNSGFWVNPLPARLAYKLATIPVPQFHSNYLWGWLKGPSTETTGANNRIEIASEYTLEQWSTDLYAPY